MNRLGIVFIVGALILSAILTTSIYKHQKNKALAEANEQHAQVLVLVTTKELNRGMVLREVDVAWKSWSKVTVSPLFIIQDVRRKEDVLGSVVRVPIAKGQPITDNLLIAQSSLSPLASLLSQGMRGFTIDISLSSAVAGLLIPGDTVDVIWAYPVQRSGSSGGAQKTYISTTILHGINIIAVDQETSPVPTTSKINIRTPLSSTMKNVTLEVTPKQAEILALARSIGILSLSLSTPADAEISATTNQVTSTGISDLNETNDNQESIEVTLYHGDKQEQTDKGGL